MKRNFSRPGALLGSMVAVIAAAALAVPAIASHPEASLAGSNFEIDVNANLKVDDPAPPSLDWANVIEARATDVATGTNDDSYSGGTKEDTACPGETTGSIPNNKSDLRTFHVYREAGSLGHPGFLNLAWSRVTDPSGTTLMDFEFNQSSTSCASGPNKLRTPGDLLIEYLIDQGGARADITLRTWSGSAWGAPQDLDEPNALCGNAPCASGTISSSDIPAADSDGIIAGGTMAARTFGEAQLDLRLIFQANKCTTFGSAMLKSRSSDAFTSQLKDFIRPLGINLSNCGRVIIRKETIPEENPNATNFGYTKSFGTDPTSTNTFTLQDDGSKEFTNVLFGSGHTVVEDVIPANWALDHIDCSASSGVTPSTSGATITFDIDAATDVLDCTYFNKLQVGALRILKDSTKGGRVANAGAVFNYGTGLNVTDNGTGDLDSDVGEVCVAGLLTGNYTVTETTPPPGYGGDGSSHIATVVAGTNCTSPLPSGTAVVTFVNPPLADIQVNYRDGGSGETSLTSIDCSGLGTSPDTLDATPATGWDASATHEDIAINPSPRIITCTIEIDP